MRDYLEKALATIICVILMPVLLIIALVIKLTSKGPILYQQVRVGKYGKTFIIYKFRTMPLNAEKETGPVWATSNDPRPYPFGKFLRNWGLDELPQLFNILRGDMSLIGPRPERPFFVRQFNQVYSHYSHRHLVKPGVIGWAQVHGFRGNTSLQKRLEYDLFYVYNHSWSLNVRILTMLSNWRLFTQHA